MTTLEIVIICTLVFLLGYLIGGIAMMSTALKTLDRANAVNVETEEMVNKAKILLAKVKEIND